MVNYSQIIIFWHKVSFAAKMFVQNFFSCMPFGKMKSAKRIAIFFFAPVTCFLNLAHLCCVLFSFFLVALPAFRHCAIIGSKTSLFCVFVTNICGWAMSLILVGGAMKPSAHTMTALVLRKFNHYSEIQFLKIAVTFTMLFSISIAKNTEATYPIILNSQQYTPHAQPLRPWIARPQPMISISEWLKRIPKLVFGCADIFLFF